MSEATQTVISDQLGELGDKVEALLKRAAADADKPSAIKDGVAKDLSNLPAAGTPLNIFVEVEGLAFSVDDTEQALLGAGAVASSSDVCAGGSSLEQRKAALQELSFPLRGVIELLDGQGVVLRDDFVEFCEQCCMRRLSVSVCSKGFKELIRRFLRGAGLGHVEVHANDSSVDLEGNWAPCFRDSSDSGHDKARSVRCAKIDLNTNTP